MGVFDLLDSLGNGLAVRNLRLADVGFNVELATHTVNQDLEVKFTHTGDDRLAGLIIRVNAEGWILVREALNRDAQLILVTLGLRLDRDLDDRGRECHRFEDDWVRWITERLSCRGVLQTHDGNNFTRANRFDFFALVRMHSVDLADALLATLDAVEHGRARVQGAGVDANIGQLAEVWIGSDLESERCEGLGSIWLAVDLD